MLHFSAFQGPIIDLVEEKDIHTIWQFGNECTKDAVSIHLKGQLVSHVRQGKWKMSIFRCASISWIHVRESLTN